MSPSDPVPALILDLLEWIGPDARPYEEVFDAWRTSCPRLPIWEEAHENGLLLHEYRDGVLMMRASPAGRAHLSASRPRSSARSAE